jgi:L-fucose mutarotase
MLKNIPSILPPELLMRLCEMAHGDVVAIAGANFPGVSLAKAKGAYLVRADGASIPDMLEAILSLIPLDDYTDTPVTLMQTDDPAMRVPVWESYRRIIPKHDARGEDVIAHCERLKFYERTKDAYCIVQTGDPSTYASILLKKGIVRV